jgi:nucleotide-binding universal stress UspA family protein
LSVKSFCASVVGDDLTSTFQNGEKGLEMIELKRILLPTDFSEQSGEATRYACALAEQFGAELHVVHVLEYHPGAPTFGGGIAVSTLVEESKSAAEKGLQKVIDPNWEKGRQVVRATVSGAPFVEIIRYAKEHEIDMIVMGTHGRSGLVHVLLGSVAERVVRKSPCPVLTVRPGGHQFVMP